MSLVRKEEARLPAPPATAPRPQLAPFLLWTLARVSQVEPRHRRASNGCPRCGRGKVPPVSGPESKGVNLGKWKGDLEELGKKKKPTLTHVPVLQERVELKKCHWGHHSRLQAQGHLPARPQISISWLFFLFKVTRVGSPNSEAEEHFVTGFDKAGGSRSPPGEGD